MSYATLAQLKESLRITDTVDDTVLQLALDASTDLVDAHCGRTFIADPVASTRYFVPAGYRVEVNDIYTTVGLVVVSGSTVLTAEVYNGASGYRLEPRNAASLGEPWTSIILSSWGSSNPFMAGTGTALAVTAKWGYAATIPKSVIEANLLQASRLFSRRQSPYGVAGSPDLGGELRLLAKVDPDVAVLLARYVKVEIL